MKPVVLIALGLSFAGATALAFAQGPAGNGPSARHAELDTNGDGAIDRSEAAKAPRLAGHFDTLDANKDGTLTGAELNGLAVALAKEAVKPVQDTMVKSFTDFSKTLAA